MGVDPKRPLVGFALVAVLCAVLMTLSVARGSASLDLLHRGRPIAVAVAVERTPVAPAAEAPDVSTPVVLPAELSPQPIGVLASRHLPRRTIAAPEPAVESDAPSDAQAAEAKVDVRAARASVKAQRQAQRATVKAQHQAQRATVKAQRQAERTATKTQRQADKATAKAQRQAERATAKAVRDAAKLARKG